jgi:hypothetical protein
MERLFNITLYKNDGEFYFACPLIYPDIRIVGKSPVSSRPYIFVVKEEERQRVGR